MLRNRNIAGSKLLWAFVRESHDVVDLDLSLTARNALILLQLSSQCDICRSPVEVVCLRSSGQVFSSDLCCLTSVKCLLYTCYPLVLLAQMQAWTCSLQISEDKSFWAIYGISLAILYISEVFILKALFCVEYWSYTFVNSLIWPIQLGSRIRIQMNLRGETCSLVYQKAELLR